MKLNKIIKVIIILILLLLIYIAVQLCLYRYEQKQNQKFISYCEKLNTNIYQTEKFNKTENKYYKLQTEDPKSCYCRMRTLLQPRLLVYKVKSENENLEFVKPAFEDVLIPENILEKADIYINYVTPDDDNLIKSISEYYEKPVYSFYCDKKIIKSDNPNFYYYNTCYDEKNKKYKNENTFGENLKAINAENKKIYLNKFFIRKIESKSKLEDILNNSDNIIGMTLSISLNDSDLVIATNELLKSIEKKFILVASTDAFYGMSLGCKCRYLDGKLPRVILLTYINKNIVDKKRLLLIKEDNYIELKPSAETMLIPHKSNWIVILNEKIKNIFMVK